MGRQGGHPTTRCPRVQVALGTGSLLTSPLILLSSIVKAPSQLCGHQIMCILLACCGCCLQRPLTLLRPPESGLVPAELALPLNQLNPKPCNSGWGGCAEICMVPQGPCASCAQQGLHGHPIALAHRSGRCWREGWVVEGNAGSGFFWVKKLPDKSC